MPYRNPPPEQPIRTYPVPVIADQVLIEFVTAELASSQPLEPGVPHSNTRDFPGFKLGIQRVSTQDHNWFVRVWVTDATAEDTYNAVLKYSGDSVSFPIYARTYRELKASFSPRARGSALQTVYKLTVVLAGTGYVPGTQPALTFAGGGGTGAVGHGVVKADGTISEFVLTATGSGYTSAPTFTCAAPTSGTTATGTAAIQPTGAILVSEDPQAYPVESEFYAQYWNVLRVYETLPGPLLPFTRYDDLLGPIQGTRQAVVNSGQASSLTATAKITYEAREGSSYVAWKLTEDWTASAGAGFPITYARFYDNEKGAVAQQIQIEVKASQVGTFTVVAGVVTDTRYEAFDPFHYKKIIETWAVPAPTFTVDVHDNERGEIQRATQIIAGTGSEASSSTVGGGTVTTINYEPYNALLLKKTTETWAVPRTLNDQIYDKTLDVVFPVQRKREASGTSIGVAHAEVTAQGDGTDLTRIADQTAIAAALNAYSTTFPNTVDIDFPMELLSVQVVWETSSGNGDSTESGISSASGTTFNLQHSEKNEAQGSATVMPELIPHYKPIPRGNDLPATDYFFFLANPVTRAAVLAKLTSLAGASILDWPIFQPDIPVFVLKGQKVSGQTGASAKVSLSSNDDGISYMRGTGDSLSQDFGSSIGSRTLERCIHAAISLSGDISKEESFAVVSDAQVDILGTTIEGGPREEELTAKGSVTPTSLSATSGAITIPTSGIRMKSCNVDMYGYGFSIIRARLFDFSVLA